MKFGIIRAICFLAGILFLSTILPRDLAAHGSLHDQIVDATRQIESAPGDARLFLERGELYRLHREWEKALADYEEAATLDPEISAVHLARGRMLHEAGEHRAAGESLDRFLARRPDHVEALIARARVHGKLGRREEALRDYTRAIELAERPEPQFYIERAEVAVNACLEGENGSAQSCPERIDEAVRGLDEGIAALGSIVTLELSAIDLERRRSRFDAALERVKRIALQSARQAKWLALQGEILEQAGRPDEARKAFSAALAEIESLPAGRRGNRATTQLETEIRGRLEGLSDSKTEETADSSNKGD